MQVDTYLLMLVSGTIIPLLTAILTKQTAPSGVKAVVATVLAGTIAVLAKVVEMAGVVDWKMAVVTFLGAWVAQAATYKGFWKPTGVAPALNTSTGNVGIG